MEQLGVLRFFKHLLITLIVLTIGWAVWRLFGFWWLALALVAVFAGLFYWLLHYYEVWMLELMHLQEKTEQLSNALQEASLKTGEKNEMLASKINELTTLRRITLAMISTIDLDAVLEIILESVTQQLKYDGAQFYVVDPGTAVLRLYKSMGNVEGAPALRDLERSLKEKRPLLVPGRDKHAAVIPVMAKDQVTGMLVVSHDPLKSALTEADIRTLSTYTYQAGMAVENARLYQTEKRFHEELARQVEIAKAKLLEAQKKLIASERMAAMGETSAVVAHEIKNPLGSIRAAAQLMAHGAPPGDKRHRYMQLLTQEVDRLDGLANSLLDYAKPLKARPERIDAHVVLQELMEVMQAQITEKKIELNVVFDATASEIDVNKGHLKQVVINIIQNALNFMEERGERRLRLTTQNLDDRFVLTIEDTGGGIPEEAMPHIFEPFYTTRSRGTGLGLTICQRIIMAYGGSIEAKTKPGTGATFIVALPSRSPLPT